MLGGMKIKPKSQSIVQWDNPRFTIGQNSCLGKKQTGFIYLYVNSKLF